MNAYELADQLKEYAGNNGYSHNDYADTMTQSANMLRQQADRIAELEKEKDRLEKLVHQRFDDGKRLGILDTELKYKFAPQTKPLSEHAIESIAFDYANEDGELDLVGFARAIEERHGIK
jgi:hypothetical protein